MMKINEWEVALAVDDAIRAAIRHEEIAQVMHMRNIWQNEQRSQSDEGKRGNVMVCNGCNALHNIT